jgi:hypothetical protein
VGGQGRIREDAVAGLNESVPTANGFGYGPEVEDAVSGWLFPVRLMTTQRGQLVSSFYAHGSRDRPQEW